MKISTHKGSIKKVNSGRQNSQEDVHESDKPSPIGNRGMDKITDSDAYDERDPVMGEDPDNTDNSGTPRDPKSVARSMEQKTQVARTGKSGPAPKSGLNIHGNAGKMHGSKEKAKHFSNALKQAHVLWNGGNAQVGGQNADIQNGSSDNPHNAISLPGNEPIGQKGTAGVIGAETSEMHSGGINPVSHRGPAGTAEGSSHKNAIGGKNQKTLSPRKKLPGKQPEIKYAAAGGND